MNNNPEFTKLVDQALAEKGMTRDQLDAAQVHIQNSLEYKCLHNTLISMSGLASDWTDPTLEHMLTHPLSRLLEYYHLSSYYPAIGGIVAETYSDALELVLNEDNATEVMTMLQETKVVEVQSQVGQLLFLLGYCFAMRNYTLIADLISDYQQRKESDAQSADSAPISTGDVSGTDPDPHRDP